METYHLLALSGSTKLNSSNNRLLDYILNLSNQKAAVSFHWDRFDLTRLPYFNPELDSLSAVDVNNEFIDDEIGVVGEFRAKIDKADGILIISPEYVFSLPGVLKNALEWLVSTTLLNAKPMALISAAASGIKAKESLELIIKTLGGDFNTDTSILIQGIAGKIKPNGQLKDPTDDKVLENMLTEWRTLMDIAI